MTRTTAKRSYAWLALMALLVIAGLFRFYGLDWDQRIGAHPDERYIVDVASRMSLTREPNPFKVAPDLAYGHLPLYLLALAGRLVPAVDPLLLGRALSASFDLGTVALTYALGRRIQGQRVGLLSAAFVGLMVAHVQQAHFYTPDGLLTFFTVAALLFAIRFVQDGNAQDIWLAGASAGLALGTKAAVVLLVVPLSLACSLRSDRGRQAFWQCGLAALISFLVVNPFALIEPRTFLENLARQGAIVRGAFDVPFTRQYRGTPPYVYPIVQQMRWGMGWLMGLCAFGGLVYDGVRALRGYVRPPRWILLAWVGPYLAFIGGLYAKFPRYVLPIVPALAIQAAGLNIDSARWRKRLTPILSTIILSALLLRCLALSAIYRAPHPWTEASEWMHGRLEPGATIAVEAWDHPLPVGADDYLLVELPIFEEETRAKWEAMDRALEEADYLIIASRRGYAALARWPARYDRTLAHYERLFAGSLGFECVACFERHPGLGSYVLTDDPTAGLTFSLPEPCRTEASRTLLPLGRLDESFVVYDHPQVMIFKARRSMLPATVDPPHG